MGNSKKILITGGRGFIGKKVAEELLLRGCEVTIIDKQFPDIDVKAKQNRIIFHHVDITDFDSLFDIMCGHNIVINLAAGSSFLMYEQRPVFETINVLHSFLNVLECARKHNVEKVVYASTSAVYEGNLLPYCESMVLHPPDQKALAKKTCEEFAMLYKERYGLISVGVRPFSVFGAGEIIKEGYANVISLFSWAMITGKTPAIWGDGTQKRDFIYVDDVAKIFAECALTEIDVPIINAGTGVETSFNEIIDLINRELGSQLLPIYVPIGVNIYAKRLKADITLQNKHNLLPTISLVQGIRKVINSAKALDKVDLQTLSDAQYAYKLFLKL